MTRSADGVAKEATGKRLPVAKQQNLLPWVIPEHCEECADCVNVCPVYEIVMWETEDPDHSIPWLSNPDSCIGCGKCEEVCTWGAINMTSYVGDARGRLFKNRPYGLAMYLQGQEYCLYSNADEKLVIVTCIDSKLNLDSILKEKRENSYILCNAGNIISDCMIRSLVLAIDVLGAKQIVLLGHSKCELRHTKASELRDLLVSRVGDKSLDVLGKPFRKWLQIAVDPVFQLRSQREVLKNSHLIPDDIKITGLIYDEFNEKLQLVFGPDSEE